ncbi:MAG: AAA family ATPase [Proteobacteria bacterium]|nr:AAA family ATPase [Pseudomonadota bacterium]
MDNNSRNVLVITPSEEISKRVEAALSSHNEINLENEANTLTTLNGKAMELACKNDVILFTTDPKSETDIDALRALAKGHKDNTVFIALTRGDISLAEARELNKAGANEVLPYQTSEAELNQQIQHWIKEKYNANSQVAPSEGQSGKIIAVSQTRGGAGSTTVAVNLADQLISTKSRFNKKAKNKVALVDLDFQFGTVGSFLDIKEQDNMLQLAVDGRMPDLTFLKQSMVSLPNGLSVLPAPSKFAPINILKKDQVAAILDILKAEYDYVIVDMPRALVDWVGPIFERADKLYLVSDTSVPSIRQARRLIDFFSEGNLALPIELLINHESKPFFLSQHHKEAAKALERDFKHWIPDDPIIARKAVDCGKPISAVSPRSKLSKAFKTLAKDVLTAFPVAQHKSEIN